MYWVKCEYFPHMATLHWCWVTLHFCLLQKMTSSRTEQTIHGKLSTCHEWIVLLCSRTNNRCVESLSVSEVDKCGKYSTFGEFYPLHSLFCLLRKRMSWKSSHEWGESLNINVEVAKCGKCSHIHLVHSLFVCNAK